MKTEKQIKRIPDAELVVMQAVWDSNTPATRGEIEEHLRDGSAHAQTTLLTELARLAEKGFLAVAKEGRNNLYTPIVTREAYLASQSKSFIEKTCGGSMSLFANALCDSGLSEEDLKELQRLLKRGKR